MILQRYELILIELLLLHIIKTHNVLLLIILHNTLLEVLLLTLQVLYICRAPREIVKNIAHLEVV